jgi:hypothetical protein
VIIEPPPEEVVNESQFFSKYDDMSGDYADASIRRVHPEGREG